jgi:hypothetical protein
LRDIGGRALPPGHRAARILIVGVLTATLAFVTASTTCRAVVGWGFDRSARIVGVIWAPLLDGEPDAAPSGSP